MTAPIRLKFRTEERETAHRTAIHHSGYTANEWYRAVCNTAAEQGIRGIPGAFCRPKPTDPETIIRGAISIRPSGDERDIWEAAAADAGWPLHTWIILVADAVSGYGCLLDQLSSIR